MEALREGIDYTLDEQGRFVFTREFHLARGTCCKSGCRNCPYGFAQPGLLGVGAKSARDPEGAE